MFCPNCGVQSQSPSQFCRSCGAELSAARTAGDRPDAVTTSATNARDQIAQAIATRIRELRSADDLTQAVEEILPQLEKFLESPEERRLRRLRSGVITAAIGLGAIISSVAASAVIRGSAIDLVALIGGSCGVLAFLVGLGIIINARWLTNPMDMTHLSRNSDQIAPSELLGSPPADDLQSGRPSKLKASVTEGTTRQLE